MVLQGLDRATLNKTLHRDTAILCDSNEETIVPPESLQLTDRLVAVTTPTQSVRWRWAEKDPM